MVVNGSPFVAGATIRFVALGGSIVSDWDNPVATSVRAVLNAIAAAGHEVTFLEQRGNPSLSALLANRGSRAYKGFTERYPRIQLRTYDLPRGWQRTVWFGSEIGTADAVIALPGTPAELLPEIAASPLRHIVQLIDESFSIEHPGLRLVRAGTATDKNDLAFGPAVEHGQVDYPDRSERPLLVAYDDTDEANHLAAELAEYDPVQIVTGTADLPAWSYIPEIELPDWYARHRFAIVSGAGDSAWADARRLLPRGYGCATLFNGRPTSIAETSFAPVPHVFRAQEQADLFISAVRARQERRRAKTGPE